MIEVRNLSKRYGTNLAVDNISFDVAEGEILGFLGPNGAGKTTLIKTALGMVSTESGEIRCLGRDIRKEGREIRRRTGAVFGEIELPGTFTAKNAAKLWEKIYEDFDRERFGELSAQFRIPQEKKLQSYSAGTKVKLAIAGALSHRASLLLLDEPVTGLDPVMTEEMYQLISRINREQKVTVLMVSHDLKNILPCATHILHLDQKQLFFGTTEEYRSSEVGKEFLGGIRHV